MNSELMLQGSNSISMFCRLNVNVKKDLPIRSSEMGLLIFICKSEEKVTSNKAVKFFMVSKPMVATMVSSLVKNGYIVKEQSSDDKRLYYLIPTQKAVDLVDSAYLEYSKVMEKLVNKMGENDYRNLIKLIDIANTIILEGE